MRKIQVMLRPAVKAFAAEIETALHNNIPYLVARNYAQFTKPHLLAKLQSKVQALSDEILRNTVVRSEEAHREIIAAKAAEVGAVAMMIADNQGALDIAKTETAKLYRTETITYHFTLDMTNFDRAIRSLTRSQIAALSEIIQAELLRKKTVSAYDTATLFRSTSFERAMNARDAKKDARPYTERPTGFVSPANSPNFTPRKTEDTKRSLLLAGVCCVHCRSRRTAPKAAHTNLTPCGQDCWD